MPNADRRLASNWLTRSDVDLSAVSGLMRTITDDYGAEFAVHSERVGNAYRVTDKMNIPDLQKKLQRRIDLVTENAQRIIRIAALGPQGL